MLDINLIREKTEYVKQTLAKRSVEVDFTELLDLDGKRKDVIKKAEALKAKRNEVSAQIPKLKKEKQDVSAVMAEMKDVSEKIKNLDKDLADVNGKIKYILERLPNLPDEDVVAGGKENNEVVRTIGEKPNFSFKPLGHMDLAKSMELIDYERGTKLGGSGFWIYKGNGALLEWALLNYFIENHLADGYELVLLPHILNYECGYTAGQFPKFEEDVFKLESEEGKVQFILPTAETALASYHRDEILKEEELPRKYFGYTPCYRKEAGSYRTQERGMIRGHQFNKVELFSYTLPEQSDAIFEEMLGKAEKLVTGLGLHYQVSKLAAGDCSASMARTFDIEVWIPSMNEYKEVSSVSNSRTYQSRRGNMRVKRKETKKNEYVHTLNASGLATSRLVPAMMEQFQTEDGGMIVPEVLRKWIGKDKLDPVK